jgi:hypothetical protein
MCLGLLAAERLTAQTAPEKMSIHGYLTQGYAVADTDQTLGAPTRGTSDYRRAALLFRYAGTPTDNIVVQLAHRRLGASPTMALEPDVKVDWAFYERRFGDNTRVRLGKEPLPMGFLNETRYVGTTQPFYRAPYAFYFEGLYTSETLDGAVLTHEFSPMPDLGLTFDAFGGSYSVLEFDWVNRGGTPTYAGWRDEAGSALGTRITADLPLSGARLSAGINRASLRNPESSSSLRGTLVDWNTGAELVRERAFGRAEYRSLRFRETGLAYRAAYVQGGVRLTSRLMLSAQWENGVSQTDNRPERPFVHATTVGGSWTFAPNILLKTEIRDSKDLNADVPMSSTAMRRRIAISSISVAF